MLSLGTSAFEYNKIRMQLEYLIAVKQGVVYEPKGTFRGFMEIYGAGGIKGLYTGFRLHAARDTLVSTSFKMGRDETDRTRFRRGLGCTLPSTMPGDIL